MKTLLNRFFSINERNSSIRKEFIAALTTFATMSYVLALHPSILADAGMDRAAIITATALAAGIFSILMGLMANLPIAQAPGMGSNAFFAYTIILVMGVPWQAALGLTFWSGVIFLLLTVTGLRKVLLDAFPNDLKIALTVGIGLFLMFIGFKNSGLVVGADAPVLITIGDLSQPTVLLAALGVPLMLALNNLRIPGGILTVIVLITLVGFFITGPDGETLTQAPSAILSTPVSAADYFLAFDLMYLWQNFAYAFPVLLSLVFIDLFSSLVAIHAMCARAEITEPEQQKRYVFRALNADAIATIGASALGNSTTNVFGESAAGIESGGRTGLTAVFVGLFFILTLFINPLIMIIPSHATAPALILIGILMFSEVRNINLENMKTAGPAVLCMIMMMVTSISDGLALGLLSYVLLTALSGRIKQIPIVTWVMSVSFVIYYAFL